METVAESTPVIGHGISAGYAIAGDMERAEQIALGKSQPSSYVGCSPSVGTTRGQWIIRVVVVVVVLKQQIK